MLKQFQLVEGSLVESSADIGNVLVYIAPNEQEHQYLVDCLKIGEHNLRSALDPDEVPRLEFEPEHVVIIYKRPKNYSTEDNFLFKVDSTGVFAFNDKLVVVQSEDASLFDGKYFLCLQTLHDVLLKMIYQSIFHFVAHMKVINMLADPKRTANKNIWLACY